MNEAPGDPSRIVVELADLQSVLRVSRQEVARWVIATYAAEGVVKAEVSVALVDDLTIRVLNARHLDHDWATDVVTFPLEDETGSGEIVASTDTARREADRRGLPPTLELALYIVHGALHLCGHDDADDTGRLAMFRRQVEILGGLGFEGRHLAQLAPGAFAAEAHS